MFWSCLENGGFGKSKININTSNKEEGEFVIKNYQTVFKQINLCNRILNLWLILLNCFFQIRDQIIQEHSISSSNVQKIEYFFN